MIRRISHSLLLVVAVLAISLPASAQKIAVVADKLYTMGKEVQGQPGVVLIENGKISAVRRGSEAPAGYTVMHAAYVTPGLIDAKTTAGISGAYNIPADQDQDEESDPNTADVRALDSFNPREMLLQYINTYGITTVQTAPGIVNPIAGQAGIFKTVGPKTVGPTVDELAVKPVSAIVFNLGESPKQFYGRKDRAPTTRMMTASIIREGLLNAQAYQKKWADWSASEKRDPAKQPARDLKLEAISLALRAEVPAIFNAYRADDIDTAIRLAKEFKLKLILSSVTEGYLETPVIKQSGAAALVGPTLQRLESLETNNASLEDAAILAEAGVPVALMTGFEGYVPKNRVLLFEAGVAAANGLGFEGALRASTIEAAKILGIADRIGSLESGKDADVVLYDGDPFEYTSHVTAVLVNGKVSYQRE
ncbi:MAG TPA: amidohydrolase family protein [Silvibacterium sp.]|nr:amidohydrolase family protein [Silvibacterium sp.]